MDDTRLERKSQSVTFRLQPVLLNDLERVCARLDLEKSEVCRRAVAVGLRAFDDCNLPGSPESVAGREGL